MFRYSNTEQRAKALLLYGKSREKEHKRALLGSHDHSRILRLTDMVNDALIRHKKPSDFIMRKLLGHYPDNASMTRDNDYMDEFLKMNSPNGLPKCSSFNIATTIPEGVPLIRALDADMLLNPVGYKFPRRPWLDQLLDSSSIDQFTNTADVWEIDIVHATPEEKAKFVMWAAENQEANHANFPANFLSVDLEAILVHPDDLDRVRREHAKLRNGDPDATNIIHSTSEGKAQLITRILLGDGITWSASINFPWKPGKTPGSIEFHIGTLSPDDQLLQFLLRQQIWVGHGIINDRNQLQDLLLDMYGIDQRFPLPVEMQALLCIAGSGYPRHKMFVNHLLITGTLLNKSVSCCDNMWHYPLSEIPSMAYYALGDIKSGYICTVVLLALILRDFFPDPHAACFAFEVTQPDWVEYFSSLILTLAADKEMCPNLRPLACSLDRKEILLSLRGYDYSTAKRTMYNSPDPKLSDLADALPIWPTVPYGGARNLHKVRSHFLRQYQAVSNIGHLCPRIHVNLDRLKGCDGSLKAFKKDLLFEHDIEHYKYWIPRTHHTASVTKPGLLPEPVMMRRAFKIDLKDLSFPTLQAEARRHNREILPALLEFARLNPSSIQDIMTFLIKSDLKSEKMKWWWTKTRAYEQLRLMYQALYCRPSFRVPALEQEIARRNINAEADLNKSKPTAQHERRAEIASQLKMKSAVEPKLRVGLKNKAIIAQPAANHFQRTSNNHHRSISNHGAKREQGSHSVNRTRSTPRARSTSTSQTKRAKFDLRDKLDDDNSFKARSTSTSKRIKFDLRDKLDEYHQSPDYEPPQAHFEPTAHVARREVHNPYPGPNFQVTANYNARDVDSCGRVSHMGPSFESHRAQAFDPYNPFVPRTFETEPQYAVSARRGIPASQRVSGKRKKSKKKAQPAQSNQVVLPYDPEDSEDENLGRIRDLNDITLDSPYVQGNLQSMGYNPSRKNRRYY